MRRLTLAVVVPTLPLSIVIVSVLPLAILPQLPACSRP